MVASMLFFWFKQPSIPFYAIDFYLFYVCKCLCIYSSITAALRSEMLIRKSTVFCLDYNRISYKYNTSGPVNYSGIMASRRIGHLIKHPGNPPYPDQVNTVNLIPRYSILGISYPITNCKHAPGKLPHCLRGQRNLLAMRTGECPKLFFQRGYSHLWIRL